MTHPIFALDPEGYQAHALHHHEQAWRESNCYLDVWIEVLHALGLDVEAGLAFPLASTFEHDQWTFFKPPHTDLWELYGVEVEELTLWLPLLEHAQNQVRAGRLPLVEMDAYYLPDTAGSDYRSAHVKTTIAITAVDPAARRLRYFHNAGFHRLEGEDFDGIFRLGRPEHEDYLPPYCEIVKVDRARRLEPVALRALSLRLAAEHFARRPAENPIRAYAARVPEHLDLVLSRGEAAFHGYGFAAVRQLGAAFACVAAWARWLDQGAGGGWGEAAGSFEAISGVAKMLILKLARIASSGKVRDLSGNFEDMAQAWDAGMQRVGEQLSG